MGVTALPDKGLQDLLMPALLRAKAFGMVAPAVVPSALPTRHSQEGGKFNVHSVGLIPSLDSSTWSDRVRG